MSCLLIYLHSLKPGKIRPKAAEILGILSLSFLFSLFVAHLSSAVFFRGEDLEEGRNSTDTHVPWVLPRGEFHTEAWLVLVLWASSAGSSLVPLSHLRLVLGAVRASGVDPAAR